jgi:hypothetical protein
MSLMGAYTPYAVTVAQFGRNVLYLWLTPTHEVLTLLHHHQRCTSTYGVWG